MRCYIQFFYKSITVINLWFYSCSSLFNPLAERFPVYMYVYRKSAKSPSLGNIREPIKKALVKDKQTERVNHTPPPPVHLFRLF